MKTRVSGMNLFFGILLLLGTANTASGSQAALERDFVLGCGKSYKNSISNVEESDRRAKEIFDRLVSDRRVESGNPSKVRYNCTRCHGIQQSEKTQAPAKVFLSFENFKEFAGENPARFSAYLDEMPTDDGPEILNEHKLALVEWSKQVKEGAPKSEQFVSFDSVLQCMAKDASQFAGSPEAKKIRYFTLTHLHNAKEKKQLRVYRAAIAFLINSLSWSPKIKQPTAIDPLKTIFRINLDDYQWPNQNWVELGKIDPYPIRPNSPAGKTALASLKTILSAGAPSVRGDWFVSVGSIPVRSTIDSNPGLKRRFENGLYETLLGISGNLQQLESLLGVNRTRNIANNHIQRAATIESGVSNAQRTIERHQIPLKERYKNTSLDHPYYWVSYDYAQDKRDFKQALLSIDRPSGELEEDGGEFIFSLPNGLQAYFVANAKGRRLDSAPLKIASNKFDRQNNHVVYTGFSCMGCHNSGILNMKNMVDYSHGNGGDFARINYPPEGKMRSLFTTDRKQFASAVKQVLGSVPTSNPVFEGQLLHLRPLSIKLAAAEMGVSRREFEKAYVSAVGIEYKPNLTFNRIERSFFAKNFLKISKHLTSVSPPLVLTPVPTKPDPKKKKYSLQISDRSIADIHYLSISVYPAIKMGENVKLSLNGKKLSFRTEEKKWGPTPVTRIFLTYQGPRPAIKYDTLEVDFKAVYRELPLNQEFTFTLESDVGFGSIKWKSPRDEKSRYK